MRLYFISRHTYEAIAHPLDPRAPSTSPHQAKRQRIQPSCPSPVGLLHSAGSPQTGPRGPRMAGHNRELNSLEMGPSKNTEFQGQIPNYLTNSQGMYSRKIKIKNKKSGSHCYVSPEFCLENRIYMVFTLSRLELLSFPVTQHCNSCCSFNCYLNPKSIFSCAKYETLLLKLQRLNRGAEKI